MAVEEYSLAELEAEQKRRGGEATFPSVMAEQGTTSEELLKAGEALAKGGMMGLVNLAGGWGSYLDWRKEQEGKLTGPSKLSSTGISNFIKDMTGVDLKDVPGYKGLYEVGQMAAPAMVLRGVAPEASLFGRAATTRGAVAKTLGEGAVGAATGITAESIAPDSPLAQLLIGMSPYAAKGAVMGVQNRLLKPTGTFEPSAAALLDVGRMTPGEFGGSRVQLAKEAVAEAAPKIEAKGTTFRQAQAEDVEGFLSNIFNRASKEAISDPKQLAQTTIDAVKNFGGSLNNKLKSDAARDFGKASASNGVVDATPVIGRVLGYIDSLPEGAPGTATMRNYFNQLFDKYSQNPNISVKDLQAMLSNWGDAAYTGSAAGLNDVAPGMVRGAARSILSGFKESMDNAIAGGVEGAKDLKIARDNFSANLKNVENFRQSKINKAFGKDLGEFTDIDTIVNKIETAKPAQRDIMFNILKDEAPEVADTIRRSKFDQMLAKAQADAPAANQPTFVIGKMLKELNNKKGEFSFLFPDAADLKDVNKAMEWMGKVLQSEGANIGTNFRGDAYSLTRGAGAQSQTANLVKATYDSIKGLFAQPNAVADVVFNPNTVKQILDYKTKPTSQKAIDLVQSLAKPTAINAARASYMLGNQPSLPEQQAMPEDSYSLQELEAELARRQQ
jgi:hypothetical protein